MGRGEGTTMAPPLTYTVPVVISPRLSFEEFNRLWGFENGAVNRRDEATGELVEIGPYPPGYEAAFREATRPFTVTLKVTTDKQGKKTVTVLRLQGDAPGEGGGDPIPQGTSHTPLGRGDGGYFFQGLKTAPLSSGRGWRAG